MVHKLWMSDWELGALLLDPPLTIEANINNNTKLKRCFYASSGTNKSKHFFTLHKPTCWSWRLAGGSGPARGTDAAESIDFICTRPSVGTRCWKTLVDIWERRVTQWRYILYPRRSDCLLSLVLSQTCVISHCSRSTDTLKSVDVNESESLDANVTHMIAILCFQLCSSSLGKVLFCWQYPQSKD